MRDVIFVRVAAFALVFGVIAGIFSSSFSEKEIIENYGAWVPGFYDCNETELWVKSVFCGPIFVFGIFLTGLFIFGHLFVYPVAFYYGYTFGFLITCTIICFGMSGTPYILFRLPSMAITSMILCKGSGVAVRFSSETLSGADFFELRTKLSKYLRQGIGYVILSLFPMVYEAIFVPKILILWDSF